MKSFSVYPCVFSAMLCVKFSFIVQEFHFSLLSSARSSWAI